MSWRDRGTGSGSLGPPAGTARSFPRGPVPAGRTALRSKGKIRELGEGAWAYWAVIGFILLGLSLRLIYSLRSSLYVDEFTTIWAGRQALSHGLPWLPSGVLYTRGLFSVWLQAVFVPLLGESEWAARAPNVLISTVTLPLVYHLGRRLFGLVAALVATATLALFPDAIIWGGRARFYALFHLLIVAQLLAFWSGFVVPGREGTDGPGARRARWAWVLLVGIGLWTAEQTVLLLPVFAAGLLLWPGARRLRAREGVALLSTLAGLLLLRGAFELLGQPGQFGVIQESRPYVSPLADLGGALRAYGSFFLSPGRFGLLLAATIGLLLLWRGRNHFHSRQAGAIRAGYLDALLLVEMAFWVPLVEMILVAGPDWRDHRYLFMLVPPLALLGGAVIDRLAAAWREKEALAQTSTLLSRLVRPGVLLLATGLPLALFAGPAAAAVESQVEGYDLAFRYIQTQRQPGDAVISPQPPACAVYFGPCQGYAVSNGWEPFAIRRGGQLVDRWTGAPLVRNRAELRALLQGGSRTWVVLDRLRVATRYEPEMIHDLARLGTVAWTDRGVVVLRIEGWREPPAFTVHGEPAARFEGGARLVAFDYREPAVADGEDGGTTLPLLLQWTASMPFEESTIFVHLSGADGRLVAQDDGPPARGLFPTFLWGGDRPVPDPRTLDVPDDARGWHRLSVGLYESVSHAIRPLLDEGGQPVADAATLGYLWLGPPPAEPARRIGAAFDGLIALQGTDLPTEIAASAGERLEIPLTWQSLASVERNLTVFLHLVGGDGVPLAQADQQPTGGFFPTGRWMPGDRVPDSITLALPEDLPAGEYRLLVGLYESTSGARLALPDGSDSVTLATVRVAEPDGSSASSLGDGDEA